MAETPIKQEIPKPDVGEHAPSNPEAKPTTSSPENASAPLFDAAGAVSTSAPTESATMPLPSEMPEKRGRGRPRKDAGPGEKSALKTKQSAKKTPEVKEAEGMAAASIVVAGLDMVRKAVSAGECPENPDMRTATLAAWAQYIEENGFEIPTWLQVAIISSVYVAPAFTTESGKGKVSGAWAKIKGWYITRRG